MHAELAGKRLELLHELVPTATGAALLVNPSNPVKEQEITKFQEAAGSLGLQPHVIRAGTPSEIDAAFETVVGLGAKGLLSAGTACLPASARKSFRWRRAIPYRPFMCGGCSPRPAG
jgi:putative ABC transport system substrate-binding protein